MVIPTIFNVILPKLLLSLKQTKIKLTAVLMHPFNLKALIILRIELEHGVYRVTVERTAFGP